MKWNRLFSSRNWTPSMPDVKFSITNPAFFRILMFEFIRQSNRNSMRQSEGYSSPNSAGMPTFQLVSAFLDAEQAPQQVQSLGDDLVRVGIRQEPEANINEAFHDHRDFGFLVTDLAVQDEQRFSELQRLHVVLHQNPCCLESSPDGHL